MNRHIRALTDWSYYIKDVAGTIDIGFHMNANRRAYVRSFAQPVTALGLGMLICLLYSDLFAVQRPGHKMANKRPVV